MPDVIHEVKIGIPFATDKDLQPNVDKTTEKLFNDAYPNIVQINTDEGSGTGFFIDKKGRIATDAHVVLDSSHLTVVTSDGKKESARIVSLDDIDDLAIIQIDSGTPKNIKLLPLASSSTAQPDQRLWALGHAEGADNVYISPGYYRRSESINDLMERQSKDQKDASKKSFHLMTPLEQEDAKNYITREIFNGNINVRSGDSGGPCIDAQGKVLGLSDLSNEHSDSAFTPVEKLTALMVDPKPKFNFTYKKTDDGWTLTDITRNDGAIRPPYEDSLATGPDKHKRPNDE